MFKLVKESNKSRARVSELTTAHGSIQGPFFMPIATRAAVKSLTSEEIKELDAPIILSNTYHLLLRPGINLMKKYGGLHRFMNWSGPILTDSGGYQVFSLSKHRTITEAGASFVDPQTGKKYFLSPENAIQIQKVIGADVMMVLDECPPYPCSQAYAEQSMLLTTRWAKRCLTEHTKHKRKQLLFGIVQGSVYKKLRQASALGLVNLNFDGYAIGGVAVGEPRQAMRSILDWVVPLLPRDKPRYLMGVGRPEEILLAVRVGIDMFDCVIPTREGRHGRLYVWNGKPNILKKKFYHTITITNSKFSTDTNAINETNLRSYSKAYLHHLFKTKEPLAQHLASLNNLNFYIELMNQIRKGIVDKLL